MRACTVPAERRVGWVPELTLLKNVSKIRLHDANRGPRTHVNLLSKPRIACASPCPTCLHVLPQLPRLNHCPRRDGNPSRGHSPPRPRHLCPHHPGPCRRDSAQFLPRHAIQYARTWRRCHQHRRRVHLFRGCVDSARRLHWHGRPCLSSPPFPLPPPMPFAFSAHQKLSKLISTQYAGSCWKPCLFFVKRTTPGRIPMGVNLPKARCLHSLPFVRGTCQCTACIESIPTFSGEQHGRNAKNACFFSFA